MVRLTYREIEAKTLLSSSKEQGTYFGTQYTANLYRGCQHGCIYCDSRSSCYQIENFDGEVQVKVNAIELLRKELAGKRSKGTVSLGGMNDPYGPVERVYGLTRKALAVLAEFGFPVHVITKSDLVIRDVDLLREIGRTYSAVSFTITTADDALARRTEPRAPSPTRRFAAMAELAKQGVYTGVTMHPVLPFLNDTPEGIVEIMQKTKHAGGQYVMPYFGVTLREGNRGHFYRELDERFPMARFRYEKTFGDSYECMSPRWSELLEVHRSTCEELGLVSEMRHFKATPRTEQVKLF